MFRLVASLLAATILLACATTTPEMKLATGYRTISAVDKTTLVLVQRDDVKTSDAQIIADMSKTAKTALDKGKDALKSCYASQVTPDASKCTAAVSLVDLASAVSLDLEKYLAANNPTGAKP